MKTKRIFSTILLLIMSVLAVSLMMSGCGPGQLFSPTITPTISPTPTITPTPTVGPGGFPRRFHVEGNAFVDQFDQKMIFRGMAMPSPILMAYAPELGRPNWNEHYFQIMASWGAKIIRVPIDSWDIHKYGWSSVFNALNQTIAWAGENKMYVVIDFHSCGSIAENWYNGYQEDPHLTTKLQEWLDFWDKISHRYANNDIVAFYEIFNEPANPIQPPTKAMWMTWKGVAEKAISVIRANDPDKIILVGGLDWAYNLSFVTDAPIAYNNIGYTTHPYQLKMIFSLSWDTAFGKLSEKYVVFATEFGYQDDMPGFENTMIGNKLYSQAIIDYLEEHHISWMVWVFDHIMGTSLLLDRNFTPSPSGEFFRSRLLELNFPGVPTPPLPTP